MSKKILCCCASLLAAVCVFADTLINATIEINGITINGGSVYAAVYSNENNYKAENPFVSFILASTSNTIIRNLELPVGEYVVSVFQDINSNGELDTNIFGIPREPVGITNYNGRGIPGGFQKLKVPVNNISTRITVNIGSVR